MSLDKLIEFHAAVNSDSDLKNLIVKSKGDLDEVLKISDEANFQVAKGDWLKLQAMRLGGNRTLEERLKNWDKLLQPLTSEECRMLVPPSLD